MKKPIMFRIVPRRKISIGLSLNWEKFQQGLDVSGRWYALQDLYIIRGHRCYHTFHNASMHDIKILFGNAPAFCICFLCELLSVALILWSRLLWHSGNCAENEIKEWWLVAHCNIKSSCWSSKHKLTCKGLGVTFLSRQIRRKVYQLFQGWSLPFSPCQMHQKHSWVRLLMSIHSLRFVPILPKFFKISTPSPKFPKLTPKFFLGSYHGWQFPDPGLTWGFPTAPHRGRSRCSPLSPAQSPASPSPALNPPSSSLEDGSSSSRRHDP